MGEWMYTNIKNKCTKRTFQEVPLNKIFSLKERYSWRHRDRYQQIYLSAEDILPITTALNFLWMQCTLIITSSSITTLFYGEKLSRHSRKQNVCCRTFNIVAWGSPSRLLSKNTKIRIYKTIILPVVLYGCETWSLTLREEHRQSIWEQGAEENIWTKEGW
jgi:hypothetical protein